MNLRFLGNISCLTPATIIRIPINGKYALRVICSDSKSTEDKSNATLTEKLVKGTVIELFTITCLVLSSVYDFASLPNVIAIS